LVVFQDENLLRQLLDGKRRKINPNATSDCG
jgi:hypothetical protein